MDFRRLQLSEIDICMYAKGRRIAFSFERLYNRDITMVDNVQLSVTLGNDFRNVQPSGIVEPMSVKISGVTYFSTAELTEELGISRQTLWRWRQEGKIPPGHRYRNRNLLFTTHEVEVIRHFANRIEPIEPPDIDHPQLFDGNQISS